MEASSNSQPCPPDLNKEMSSIGKIIMNQSRDRMQDNTTKRHPRITSSKTPDFSRKAAYHQPQNFKKKEHNIERSGSLKIALESTITLLSERRGSLEVSRLSITDEGGARRKSSDGRGFTPNKIFQDKTKKDADSISSNDKYGPVLANDKYIPLVPQRKLKNIVKDEFTEFSEYGSRYTQQDEVENNNKKWQKESTACLIDETQKSLENAEVASWTQVPSPHTIKRHIFHQHPRHLVNMATTRSGQKTQRGFSSISDSDSGFEGDIQANLDLKIKHLDFQKEYDMIQLIGEGWFSRVYLTEHRQSREEVVLKAINSDIVSLDEFYREYRHSYILSAHTYVLTVFEMVFQADGYYMFGMEHAPLGDLTSNTTDQGVGECHTKSIAIQIGSALDWIHSKSLCHLDVKLDNILVFKSDFSLVKLCDFGSIKAAGDIVIKKNELLPYCPPELMAKHANEYYQVAHVQDVFQFGIVMFFCLSGILPWQKADITDPNYNDFFMWRTKTTSKIPRNFKAMTSRAQKLFRKLLDPDPCKRLNLCETTKYIEDKWLRKGSKSNSDTKEIGDGLSQLTLGSFQSVHSNAVEKNKMLYTLLQHGVETTVDRSHKNNRIISWIKQGAESNDLPSIMDSHSEETIIDSCQDLTMDNMNRFK